MTPAERLKLSAEFLRAVGREVVHYESDCSGCHGWYYISEERFPVNEIMGELGGKRKRPKVPDLTVEHELGRVVRLVRERHGYRLEISFNLNGTCRATIRGANYEKLGSHTTDLCLDLSDPELASLAMLRAAIAAAGATEGGA